MPLILERVYPVLLGLLCAGTYLLIPAARTYAMPESLAGLMSAVVSIGGISVGFLATAKSILISIDERSIVKKLKATGYYKRIMGYLRAAIRWSFLLTIVSGAALLVSLEPSGTPPAFNWTIWHAWGFALWMFLVVTATASYYRVIEIFYAVMDTLD